jgi:hypothetical protein
MRENRKAVQISKETWNKIDELSRSSGMTYKEIIDDAFGVNLSVKDVISSTEQVKFGKRSKMIKPDSLIIDTAILNIEWNSQVQKRSYIKTMVIWKMKDWVDLYTRFTLNMEQYLSPLELAFAARLRALVSGGFLINEGRGKYSIGKIKSSEWALIEAIESIKPTRGISTHFGILSLLKKRDEERYAKA